MSEHTRTVDAPAPPTVSGPDGRHRAPHRRVNRPRRGHMALISTATPTLPRPTAHVYTLATVADGKGAYTIVDISDPAAPVVKGSDGAAALRGPLPLIWPIADGRCLDTDNAAVISHAGTVSRSPSPCTPRRYASTDARTNDISTE